MAYAIRFYTEDDDARGVNNDGLPDIMNRPIRDLLAGSQYLADGSDFDGFAKLPDLVALTNPFMTQAAVATDATPVGSGGATNQRTYTLTGTFNAATDRQLRIFSAEATYQGSSVSGSVVAGAISSGQTGRNFTGHISSASGLVGIGSRLVSTGTVDRIQGVYGIALARGGTMGAMRGVTAHVRSLNDPLATDGPSAVTGDVAAFYVEPGLLHASTTIAGNTYGFYMDDPSNWGGTVTGKRYGIYVGGGESFLGGNVVVGGPTANLLVQFGQAARVDGVAQTTEVQLRRNAQGFAQMHFHNGVGGAETHEWKVGTSADGSFAIWNGNPAGHEEIWEAYQNGAAPAFPDQSALGKWQYFYGNIHQDGQIVQDTLYDATWKLYSIPSGQPAGSGGVNAWVTKATIDANDTITRQFRAFYGWTQYRGSGISPNTTVQGGLFYGETAENFTGEIARAVGVVGLGSRLVAGTGIIRDLVGISGVAFSAGGPTTNMWGLSASVIALGTSALTTVRGVMVDVANVSVTTTISGDMAGIHVTDVNTWGGVVSGKRYALNTEGGGIRFLSASTVAAPSTGTAFHVNVWGTSNDTTVTSFGQNMVTVNHTHTNNSTTAKQPRGMYVITYYNGAGLAPSTSVQGALFEAATDPTFTGSVGSVVGIVSQAVRNGNAGAIATGITGIQASAITFSNATGTVALLRSIATSLIAIGATNLITGDVRAIDIQRGSLGTASVGGNIVGLYVDDVALWGGAFTSTGVRYAIYVGGGAVHMGAGPMYLLSPNGSRWAVTVSNAGALTVAAA